MTVNCPCGDRTPTHFCPDDLWDESDSGWFEYRVVTNFLFDFADRVRQDERRKIERTKPYLSGPHTARWIGLPYYFVLVGGVTVTQRLGLTRGHARRRAICAIDALLVAQK